MIDITATLGSRYIQILKKKCDREHMPFIKGELRKVKSKSFAGYTTKVSHFVCEIDDLRYFVTQIIPKLERKQWMQIYYPNACNKLVNLLERIDNGNFTEEAQLA